MRIMLSPKDLKLRGKTVFLRVDFNVPITQEGKITDDNRIRTALPTLNYLLNKDAKVIIGSHLGRPKGKFIPELSLKFVLKRLSELTSKEITFADDVIGERVDKLKMLLKNGQALLLENLRFYPEESRNDTYFAQKLAKHVDFYVNDAFSTCHRIHASIIAITQYVKKSAGGFQLNREIKYLSKLIYSPEKPYTIILGGAKVSDKIPVIQNLLNKADNILIGGAMAYTFLAAQGFDVGRSLIEEDKEELALLLLKEAREKSVQIHFPLDHIIAAKLEPRSRSLTIEDFPIPKDFMAVDIGPKTVDKYSKIISEAKTIFWNGPLGVFEIDKFSKGTNKIARAIANSNALSIIGGGESSAAVYKAGLDKNISHISTGGGASLEFIANETLPGIEVLREK